MIEDVLDAVKLNVFYNFYRAFRRGGCHESDDINFIRVPLVFWKMSQVYF